MQSRFSKTEDHFYQKSDVILLPIIDLQPTNLTYIYSTLLFIQSQADKFNILAPVVTFDQPLWYKASGIKAEKKLDIVCRFGGFHTLVSFIGRIGYVMGGSGLEEVLTEVYTENSVFHMFSGKAYARAVRGYILVDSDLNKMLTEEHFCTNYDGLQASLLETFASFMLTRHITTRHQHNCI